MILSHRHKFIFFCNGRTASTSISQALEPIQEGDAYNLSMPGLFARPHIPPSLLKGCLPAAQWTGYFKYVVVRNPWSWVVSQWKRNFHRLDIPPQSSEAERQALERHNILVDKTCLQADDIDLIYQLLYYYRGLPHSSGLFQTNYILDPDGQMLVDQVGRFEALDQVVATLETYLGYPLKLSHLNSSDLQPIQTYYSAGARARVAELWAQDIAYLGYTFPEAT